jgi:hypothetical protein
VHIKTEENHMENILIVPVKYGQVKKIPIA